MTVFGTRVRNLVGKEERLDAKHYFYFGILAASVCFQLLDCETDLVF